MSRHRSGRPHALLVVENCSVPRDRRVWNQARALVGAGYDVTVISPAHRKSGEDARRERRDGIDIRRFPMPFGGPRKIDFLFEYLWAIVACHWLAIRTWISKPFDVIHVANPPDVFFTLKWLFGRRGVGFIFDQHDLGPETYQSKFEEERQDLLARALGWLEWRSYRAADAVIVTNESYRQRAVTRGAMADSDVFTVRNGPDPELFTPRQPRPELKDGHEHLVVFVGTMGHQDGVHVLLEAAHQMREVEGRRDVLFVLVGTGDAWDDLQSRHQQLGLGDGVRFTGFIPDEEMLDYLATADVGAAPDIDSPLNNISTMIKTMDYMAMGLPVVSFDLVESRVSAGPAAAYAGDHSPVAFADAILYVLDDADRRERMGRIGRERIAGPLAWERSAERLLAAYGRATRSGTASLADSEPLRRGRADQPRRMDRHPVQADESTGAGPFGSWPEIG